MAEATIPLLLERHHLPRQLQAKSVGTDCVLGTAAGPERDATGYKGFYYHFLDMETGSPRR
jgi:hypothetical protein